MKNFLTFIALMMATLPCLASVTNTEDEFDDEMAATQWYADRCQSIITRFEGLRHDSGQLAQKYCVIPYADAAYHHCALIVATWDERFMVMFTPKGNDVTGKTVGKDILPDPHYWTGISHLLSNATPSTDITLSQRPLPVRDADQTRNQFSVVIDTSDKIPDIERYNQMIFKPHQNPVRLVDQNRMVKRGEMGDTILDEMNYDFKLNTPAVASKMFRGYKNEEMAPWIVKKEFFDQHTLLQFSRWKDGEAVQRASQEVREAISRHYNGRRIKQTKWLATVEQTGKSYYAVQFEHEGGDALAAMVAIDGGEVTSAWEFHGSMEPQTYKEEQSIWFVDDEGDFMSHAPELQCVVDTPKGTELYIRLFGGESVQYYVVREVGEVMMTLQTDYWIYVW